MNLPNLITILRLLLVPVIVFLMLKGLMGAAFLVFLVAGISDAVDGMLAKRLDQVTKLGTYLDPIADKVLLVSIYVTLGAGDHLPVWLVILVVSRDLLIVGGALLSHAMDLALRIQPLLISKINTTAQIALAAIVLGELGLDLDLDADVLVTPVVVVVAATTVLSGANYLVQWLLGQSIEDTR